MVFPGDAQFGSVTMLEVLWIELKVLTALECYYHV